MALRANRPTTKHKLEALLQAIEGLKPCRTISTAARSTVKQWDERQVDGLLAILQPVVTQPRTHEEQTQWRKSYNDVCNSLGEDPLSTLRKRLQAWHNRTTDLTKQENRQSAATTWTQQLHTILTKLLDDTETLEKSYTPVVTPQSVHNYRPSRREDGHGIQTRIADEQARIKDKEALERERAARKKKEDLERDRAALKKKEEDLASESRSLKAERDHSIEMSEDYTAETYLHLLLHMFDVPRKQFTYTTNMKQDNDETHREKIVDFYPAEHNFYIELYTDNKHDRDTFKSQESIMKLLRDCAFYFLIHERLINSTNSLLVDPRVTNVCFVLYQLKAADPPVT